MMLNWTRSLSDAIFVSGKLLRDEPNLQCIVAKEFEHDSKDKLYGIITNDTSIFQKDLEFFNVNYEKFIVFTQNCDVLDNVKEFGKLKGVRIECILISKLDEISHWIRSRKSSFTLSVEAGPIVTNQLFYSSPFKNLPDIIVLNEFELKSDSKNLEILLEQCLGGKTIPRDILEQFYQRISYFEENPWKYQIFRKRQ
jgi:hypothetical protein